MPRGCVGCERNHDQERREGDRHESTNEGVESPYHVHRTCFRSRCDVAAEHVLPEASACTRRRVPHPSTSLRDGLSLGTGGTHTQLVARSVSRTYTHISHRAGHARCELAHGSSSAKALKRHPRPRFQPSRTRCKSSPAGQAWEGWVAGKRAVCRPDGLITWAPARVEGFRPAGSAVVVTLGQLCPTRSWRATLGPGGRDEAASQTRGAGSTRADTAAGQGACSRRRSPSTAVPH